ncbi:uncharacterized protein [Sagmatias obliquidens]|uniref:uncharacterized protein n=1 Tax=Sagmatias obliquidens TaxID=3371155 RepID=UPI000F445D88|nr:uncharacterized protein LOC113617665 [Lagenorhynchus obliquidens]
MPLYYSLNVALIQIPISKRVADPRRLHSFSETEPQTARVREGWDTAVRERAFLAQRPLSAERERERERVRRDEQQAEGESGTTAGRGNLTLQGHHLPGPYSRRRKEAVCVLRLPSDSGSCLLAGASIPAQLDWGATLPGSGTRANKTTKKHKMNRQSNQPKSRGSSTPARRHLLLPSLEAL